MLIGLICAVVVIVLLAGALVFTLVRNSQNEPDKVATASPTPTPTAPSSSSAGASFTPDRVAMSASIPARSGENHGCLGEAITLDGGKAVGLGVIGNGSATSIDIQVQGLPLAGTFGPGQQPVSIFALTCSSVDAPAEEGVMIDVAVLTYGGELLPTVPADLFDAVSASMASASPEFFPVFSAESITLEMVDGTPMMSGHTLSIPGSAPGDSFGFTTGLSSAATAGPIVLTTASTPG